MMPFPALSVHNVCKEFGADVRALQHIDLEVPQGETVVLIGESGSGKTTLLRMLNGLDMASLNFLQRHNSSFVIYP